MMKAFERLDAAVCGEVPDRIPVSVWFHFGSEHLPPEAVARLHLDYFRTYRWDFLKVMFDYRVELPDRIDDRHDLDVDLLLSQTRWSAPFERQFACLRILHAELGGEAPVIETVYSPWMYLLRHVGYDQAHALLERPQLAAELVGRITDETCRHINRLKEAGIHGIYFATTAGCAAVGGAEFALQSREDSTVLAEAGGLVRILHLHGSDTDPARVRDYPREVLHREDRDPANPGLQALRSRTGGAVMGGLPHDTLTRISQSGLRATIVDAVDAAGRAGFILAPGCVVSPSIARRTLLGIRNDPYLCNNA